MLDLKSKIQRRGSEGLCWIYRLRCNRASRLLTLYLSLSSIPWRRSSSLLLIGLNKPQRGESHLYYLHYSALLKSCQGVFSRNAILRSFGETCRIAKSYSLPSSSFVVIASWESNCEICTRPWTPSSNLISAP